MTEGLERRRREGREYSFNTGVSMSANTMTRRAALLAAAGFGAALLGACNAPQAPGIQTQAAQATAPGIHIGAIQVDTAPLAAAVGEPTAGWAQQALPGQLAHVLASRMAPGEAGAATLSVVVNSIYLGGGGPADPDIITGAATLNGRQTSIKAVSTWFPSPTDQALPEQAMRGRVQSLAQAFAYRLRRKMRL